MGRPMSDNKYMVTMRDKAGKTLRVDVYDVLDAFPITCPALQHLTKKALFAGRRGHKDQLQDLMDIRASADRAIEIYHSRRIAEEAQDDLEARPKAAVFICEKLPNEIPVEVNQCLPLKIGQKRMSADGKGSIWVNYFGSVHSQILVEGAIPPELYTRLNTDIIEQYPLVVI